MVAEDGKAEQDCCSLIVPAPKRPLGPLDPKDPYREADFQLGGPWQLLAESGVVALKRALSTLPQRKYLVLTSTGKRGEGDKYLEQTITEPPYASPCHSPWKEDERAACLGMRSCR